MNLWIRSQDGEFLIKTDSLEIRYDEYEIENTNYRIVACCDTVGIYKTKERALEVLGEIEHRILNINNKDDNVFAECVYKMPKE